MKIRARAYTVVNGFAFLLFLIISVFFICISIWAFKEDGFNWTTLFFFLFAAFNAFLSYNFFLMFMSYNYNLELGDNAVIFTFFLNRTIRYSDITQMYMVTLHRKVGDDINIIKLKSYGTIRLGIDALSENDRNLIIHNLKQKTNKSIIVIKSKFFI